MVKIVNNQPLEFYINKIKNKEPFKFIRYGDAEWEFYLKLKKNGEKVVKFETLYDNDVSNEIIKTVKKPKESDSYFYALQNLSITRFGDKIPQLNWYNSDVFHMASWKGQILPFLKELRNHKVVFIAGSYMRAIFDMVPFIHFIDVPEVNCYFERDKIKKALLEYGEPHIYLFQCSVLSCILFYDVDIPGATFIDMGSVLDPFVDRFNRKYHDIIKSDGTLTKYKKELRNEG